MAKKTRKVLKQESQQRAYQQAVANVNAVDVVVAPTAPTPATAAHSSKFETEGLQEFTYVKSDVRRSLALAGFFTVAMIVLSFIVH
jgi:Asp-tRNA(Asn)/Glu-tRNA(Gln) amidotransferase A subunit family amidase